MQRDAILRIREFCELDENFKGLFIEFNFELFFFSIYL